MLSIQKGSISSDEKLSINIGNFLNETMFKVNLDKQYFLNLIKIFAKDCDLSETIVLNEKHYTDFTNILEVDTEGNMNCFRMEVRNIEIFKGKNIDFRTTIFKKIHLPFYEIKLNTTTGNETKVFSIILCHKYYEVHFKTKMNTEKESLYEVSFILTNKYTKNGINDILKKLLENESEEGMLESIYQNGDTMISI